MNDEKPDVLKDEYLSPEGVEERIVDQRTYTITLTGGGKFRLYFEEKGERRHSVNVFETIEEARERLGYLMNMQGAMIIKPQMVISTILRDFFSGGEKP
jgi:hypothetical protein